MATIIIGKECCECSKTKDTKPCYECDPTIMLGQKIYDLYYCPYHMKHHLHLLINQ